MRETSNRRRSSCYNATKHGIFAGILLRGVSLGESEEAYRALVSGLRKAINPTDQMEDVQVENWHFCI